MRIRRRRITSRRKSLLAARGGIRRSSLLGDGARITKNPVARRKSLLAARGDIRRSSLLGVGARITINPVARRKNLLAARRSITRGIDSPYRRIFRVYDFTSHNQLPHSSRGSSHRVELGS